MLASLFLKAMARPLRTPTRPPRRPMIPSRRDARTRRNSLSASSA